MDIDDKNIMENFTVFKDNVFGFSNNFQLGYNTLARLFSLLWQQYVFIQDGNQFDDSQLTSEFGQLFEKKWIEVYFHVLNLAKSKCFDLKKDWSIFAIWLRNISGTQSYLNSKIAFDHRLEDKYRAPLFPPDILVSKWR